MLFFNFKINTSNHSTKSFCFCPYIDVIYPETSLHEHILPTLFAQFQADYDCLSDSGDILHFYEYEHVPRLS